MANQDECYKYVKNCSVDVTSLIKEMCDHKSSCSVFHNVEILMTKVKEHGCEKSVLSLDGRYDCEDCRLID